MKAFAALLIFLGMTSVIHAAPVTIKFATVAPEGSSWMNILRDSVNEISAKTDKRVEFKLYPGGIAGDEPDVLRKMRVGQYHGAGFTGVGLGDVVSETRLMELPFMFKSLDEMDYVKMKLTPELEKKFESKGQIFLGWAEPGLVYVFAQRPITSVNDMAGVKLWAWEGDPLADAILKAFRVTPVHIALPDVLMALQTGMLNAFYSPPLAAMALQWHSKVKYMMSEPLTNSTGGILVAKRQWDHISPADQAIVRAVFKTEMAKLTSLTRKQNEDAIEKFKQMGIKIVEPSGTGRDEMVKVATEIRPQLVSKLYSADFLKKAEAAVAEYRSKKSKK